MTLSTVVVTWDEEDAALQGVPGSITFTLATTLTDTTDGSEIRPKPRIYYHQGTGQSDPLVANDNTGVTPAGSYYDITVSPQGAAATTYQVVLNYADGATQKLSSLQQVTTLPTLQYLMPLPSGTPTSGQVPVATGVGEASAWGSAGGGGGGAVSSVFGRTGTVAATSGDYTVSEVTGAAPLASPAFTGTPTAPTASALTDSTQLATTAYADSAVSAEKTRALTAEAAAQAAAIAASLPTLTAVSVSASGTLALDKITEVTAATSLTMTLPASVTGSLIVCERASASTANVAVTGNIRGVASTTVTLQLASESEMFFGDGTTWWPIAGHKTLSSLQALFDAAGTSATETSRAETAEALLAPLASPALTGSPTAPTKTALTNNTDIATTAYADAAVGAETTRAETAEALALPKAGGTLTGWLAPAVVTLTFIGSGTTLVNAASGNVFALTLTASTTTLGSPSNPVDGQAIRVRVIQGSGGSFTLAYGTAYDFGTAGAPALSTGAAKVDILGFEYVASLAKWCYLGSGLGF